MATVSIIMPDSSFNPSNTEIFLVLPSVVGVIGSEVSYGFGGNNYDLPTHTFQLLSDARDSIVPVAISYELVVVTNKNGNYYYYEQSGTTTNNMRFVAYPSPQSLTAIQSKIGAL